MKSTGIVRKVDELGRIVLPIELRRTLDIAEKDAIEIYVDGASIILKKQGKNRFGMISASAGLVLAVICCIFITSGTGRGTLQQKETLMKKLATAETAESAEEKYSDYIEEVQ